jgi:hypothetical protein
MIGVAIVLMSGILLAAMAVPVTAQEAEPNDDFDTATTTTEGNVTGSIDNGEADYYRIEANDTDALDVAVTNAKLNDLSLTLYGPDREQFAFDGNDFEGIDHTVKLSQTGTYYIRVAGQSSDTTTDYTLNVDRVTPSENDQFAPNDGFDTAKEVSEGFNEARIVGGEADYYRIEANDTDALDVAVTNAKLNDLSLTLYGPDREQFASDGNDFEGIDHTVKLSQTGTYYIRVAGQSQQTTTDYTLNVDRVTPSENDQFAPNDGFDTAATVTGEFSEARIVGGEADYYQVGLDEGDGFFVEVTNAKLNDLSLTLYGPDRQQLTSDGNDFQGIDGSIKASATGTYYVRVAGQSQQTTTDYTLRSNQTSEVGASLTLALSPAAASVPTGETRTFDVVLTDVPDGVGAYDNLTVSVADPNTAAITDIKDATGGSVGTKTIAANGDEATLNVLFGGDTANSGNVTVATVSITGEAAGQTDLSVEATGDIATESGSLYTIGEVSGSSLSVSGTQSVSERYGDLGGEQDVIDTNLEVLSVISAFNNDEGVTNLEVLDAISEFNEESGN